MEDNNQHHEVSASPWKDLEEHLGFPSYNVSEEDPISEASPWNYADPRDSYDFGQLVQWVNLIVEEFELAHVIPPCWWMHRAISEELRALWEQAPGGDITGAWMKLLSEALTRITGKSYGWNYQNCGVNSGHIQGKLLGWKTDTSGSHRHNLDDPAKEIDIIDEAQAILKQVQQQRRVSQDYEDENSNPDGLSQYDDSENNNLDSSSQYDDQSEREDN